uniref:EGF-like domain-containing protein n=3 Tax=Cuerna arida TaxID=1464854 RepID=A0A1B6F6I7_9HEMI
MGTKFRARQCVRGDQLAKDCEGQKLEVNSCFNRMCPVDGKWGAWGPWSQCSSSCLRQRQRLCSKPLYGGKPCIGDNIQIEKCYTADCQKLPIMNTAPKSASLRISGELNGERVEGMYLDADIRQDGPKRLVTATLKDILKAQANWFPYLTFLMPPLPWNSASEKGKANNGYSLTNGNFTEESRFQFATGQELVVKHKGKGVDKTGALKVDIEVVGKVPLIQPTASVVISPYTEDYIQTGPNSLFTSSGSSLDVDGKKHPFTWNRTVVYDRSQGTMPYLVEKLSTDEIASQYNPEYQQLNFKVSSEISRKFHQDRCPQGFRLDPVHHHCSDIDECKEWRKACHKSQICENQFGSYQCQCQPGFRLSPDGVNCIDVNECEESNPCSHNCHNTRGSFYCSCPPQLALGHSGHSCRAWGELDVSESRENYDENNPDELFLEANAIESVACRPGLVWDNNKCSDVNECTNENACVEEEVCINTLGSYHCMPTPCVNSYWDQISRSCIKMCDEWPEGCSGNTTIAEIVKHEAVKLNSSSLRPYEELVKLQPLGLHLEPLTRTVYDITSNTLDVPLRIRIENGEGILYALKYFQINGITRVMIKASSFSRNYKTELYTTYYVILLYID